MNERSSPDIDEGVLHDIISGALSNGTTYSNVRRALDVAATPRKWDEGEHEGCGIDSQRALERESRHVAQPSQEPVGWGNHLPGKIEP